MIRKRRWIKLIGATETILSYIVGNKAKERISKRVLQENKARQIFWKTNISYPLICTRACQRVRTVCFSENLACFVFLNPNFKVRPFALLPTIFLLKYSQVSVSYCSYLLHTVTIPLSPDPSIRTHLINMRWKNHLYIEFQWMSWAELVSEKNIYDDYKVSE